MTPEYLVGILVLYHKKSKNYAHASSALTLILESCAFFVVFFKSIELLFLRRSHTCILLSPLLAEVELEAERLRSYLQTTEAAIMALNILAVTALITYVLVCCFVVYYCILSVYSL